MFLLYLSLLNSHIISTPVQFLLHVRPYHAPMCLPTIVIALKDAESGRSHVIFIDWVTHCYW